jgi:hypothetical protein
MRRHLDVECALVEIFHRVGPCHDYGPDLEEGDFFYSLPDRITVYRGASRSRIDGAISWTTDIEVAQRFAHGHRGIAVPDPVVATGTINKFDVFLATNERQESEILGLPRDVKIADADLDPFSDLVREHFGL